MKTLATVLAFFVLTSKLLFGQISLEYTYVGGSTFAASPQSDSKQALMVKLEVDSEKYVIIDRVNKTVNFYNLDHTFWKSISFAATTDISPVTDYYDILYISQHLFDTDNEIEFMYSDRFYDPPTFYCLTQVVNEDGSILFTEDNGAPLIKANYSQQQLPIYNTTQGTKLILSMTNGDANIYSLPGQLSSCIINNSSNEVSNEVSKEVFIGNAFPNPTSDFITIPYSFSGNEKNGIIKIYDTEGTEIKSLSVDRNFKNITLTTTELSSGTYYYQLWTSNGQAGTKKMIKIE